MNTAGISERQLHLVAFDIPIPANYGGAIDIYYKIKALAELGIGVHLHCFQYHRAESEELAKLCVSVKYYKRDLAWRHFFSNKPYIVASRSSKELIKDLLVDDYPILFEGLHSCNFLGHPKLNGRPTIVRTHNIEHEYYKSLGQVEKNLFKRQYFFNEARKLEEFEQMLRYAGCIASISRNDAGYFAAAFPGKLVRTISAFHPFDRVNIRPGPGNFALYHGSLEVGENNQAAMFLINEVFNDIPVPLVIAGNKPSAELQQAARQYPNVSLKYGLTTEEIYALVAEAQINVLPTFQATGIKLKLLSALFTGRHCLVNPPMVESTGLEGLCHIEHTASGMKRELQRLFELPFPAEEIVKREHVLKEYGFSNAHNIQELVRLIFP